jgi:uncharacterized glyoxalase superfamily protein PhnB
MSNTIDRPAKSAATSPVRAIPEGMHTVTPHLVCAGAADALEFYKKAFHATEICRIPGPNGKLMHAAIKIGDSEVMLADEFPDWNSLAPKTLNGTPVTIHLAVEDADSFAANAVAAGAKLIMPVQEMFWGDRYGILEDPSGHRWSVGTHVRDVTPEELQQAAKSACG